MNSASHVGRISFPESSEEDEYVASQGSHSRPSAFISPAGARRQDQVSNMDTIVPQSTVKQESRIRGLVKVPPLRTIMNRQYNALEDPAEEPAESPSVQAEGGSKSHEDGSSNAQQQNPGQVNLGTFGPPEDQAGAFLNQQLRKSMAPGKMDITQLADVSSKQSDPMNNVANKTILGQQLNGTGIQKSQEGTNSAEEQPKSQNAFDKFDNMAFDVESSQYASKGGPAHAITNKLNNNQMDKLQTTMYAQNYNMYEMYSVGRDMGIDISRQSQDPNQIPRVTVHDAAPGRAGTLPKQSMVQMEQLGSRVVNSQAHNLHLSQDMDKDEADIEASDDYELEDIVTDEENGGEGPKSSQDASKSRLAIQNAVSLGHGQRKDDSLSSQVKSLVREDHHPTHFSLGVNPANRNLLQQPEEGAEANDNSRVPLVGAQDPNFLRVEDALNRPAGQNEDQSDIQPRDEEMPSGQFAQLAIKQEYLDELKFNSKPSVQRLKAHINQTHPRKIDLEMDAYERWSICENVGKLLALSCWVKRKIPKFSKSVGLGPALFLLTLKSYIRMFIFVSILALPSCLILASGDRSQNLDVGKGFAEMFSLFTLGNIGDYGSVACSSDNIAQHNGKISLRCPSGELSRLISVGLNEYKDQNVCQDATKIQSTKAKLDGEGAIIKDDDTTTAVAETVYNFVPFNSECSTYLSDALVQSESVKDLQEQFDLKCRGETLCTIDYDYLHVNPLCLDVILSRAYASKYQTLYEDLDPTTAKTSKFNAFNTAYNYKESVPEPIFYVVAFCDNQELKVQGVDVTLTKSQLSRFIVASDIVILVVILLGYNFIQHQQKDFVKQFQEQNVEIRDFTLVIDKLPATFHQHNDELSLKFAIWKMIQGKINLCKKQDKCPANVNPAIVDINIVYADIEVIDKQREICRSLQKIENLHTRLVAEQTNTRRFLKMENVKGIKGQIQAETAELEKEVEFFKIKFGNRLNLEQVEPLRPDELQDVDESKVKSEARSFHENINKIYVTFACMKTKNLVERLFWKKRYSKILRLGQLCSGNQALDISEEGEPPKKLAPGEWGSLYIVENPNPKSIYFVEEFEDQKDEPFQVQTARSDPHYMKWHNMNVTPANRVCRGFVAFLGLAGIVGIILLALHLFYTVYIPNHFDTNNIFWRQSFNCRDNVTPNDVIYNELLPKARQQEGLALCFCRQFEDKLSDLLLVDFNKQLEDLKEAGKVHPFTDVDIPEYCKMYYDTYYYMQALAYGPSLLVVSLNNILGYPYVIIAAKLLKLQSRDSQTFSKFVLATLLWVSTIAFLLVFYLEKREEIEAFDSEWYLTVAATLGFALFQVFFLYYVVCLGAFFVKMCRRCIDRGLSCSTYKVSDPSKWDQEKEEDEESQNDRADEVRTSLKSQKMLNVLYTGDSFDAGFTQAQVITVLLTCLMYSGGMPLLYPICLAVLVVVYWYSKFMIVKYCEKNKEFNEGHVINSYKFLNFGFLAHLVMTALMFLNSRTLSSENLSLEDFDNSSNGHLVLTPDMSPKDLEQMPSFAKIYLIFIIVVVALFALNLFLINPVTCFFREGCCYTKKINRLDKKSKGRRAKKYLEQQKSRSRPGSQVGDIEMANNLDKYSNDPMSMGNVSLSEYSSVQSAHSASRQEVIQYQMNLDNWKHALAGENNGSFSTAGMKVSSTNFFQEIKFESLRFLYEATIEEVIQAMKRVNFYFRIAGINKDSKMGKIFLKKHEEFRRYYFSLMRNRQRIEKEIDFYCDYIEKHVDFLQFEKNYAHFIDLPSKNDNLFRDSTFSIDDKKKDSIVTSDKQEESKHAEGSSPRSLDHQPEDNIFGYNQGYRSQKSQQQENDKKNDDSQALRQSRMSVLKHSLTFKINDGEGKTQVVQVENLDQQDGKSLNKVINSFQRQNTVQIQKEDEDQEREIKLRSLQYMHKLQYLIQNFDETWLRHNYMPKKLRCTSLSQTYNIQGNLARYFGTSSQVFSPVASENAKHIIKRAEMIIADPFLTEVLNTEKEMQEREWQAKLERNGLTNGRRATQSKLFDDQDKEDVAINS